MVTRHFSSAPATLPLLLKAALPAVPLVGALPGVRHGEYVLPDIDLLRTGVTTEAEQLERYLAICGFTRGDTLPVTHPHLAAFGLHLALMTDTAFPFAPMGLVHLRNTITQHRPIGVTEEYDVRVRAGDLRPHPKGSLVDLLTDVSVGGELVWHEVTTLLSRGADGADEESPSALEDVEVPDGVVHWRLPGDLGRRYAAVSGDRNPIHLFSLSAKAFGFKSQIAHGMWTKARCLAALQNRLPDAFSVEVEFRKPVLLPTTVVLGSRPHGQGLEFGVRGARKPVPHLVGRVIPA